MTNGNEQVLSTIEASEVIDALTIAVEKLCCIETLATSIVDDMDKGLAEYRLAELLAFDLGAVAMEVESIRDKLSDARHGAPGRLSAMA